MKFKDMKKRIRWFWNTELNGNKTQQKIGPEEKVLALNTGEKKWNNKNGMLFKGKCNKCDKYGHRAPDWWGNSNTVNEKKTTAKTEIPASTENKTTVEK